jgi:F-type H+-transporting ATPase subunit delta
MPRDLTDTARRDTVMDVTQEQIARVYAVAFMGAAGKNGDAGPLVKELQSLVADVLDKFPRLEATLASALPRHEEKEMLLERIFTGRASNEVLNFLKVLSAHGRLGLLRSVLRAVLKLHAEESGRHDVEVIAACPLDATLIDELHAALRKKLNCEPVLKTRVDPSLLAGLIVKVGDTVYDSSVKTRLEKSRQAMVARAVESIEKRPERFLSAT